MKLFMITRFEPECYAHLRSVHPGIDGYSYERHLQALTEEHYNWAGDVCAELNRMGHEARLAVVNDHALQGKWASENNWNAAVTGTWEKDVVLEQVRRFRPDVFFLPSMFDYYGGFVRDVLRHSGMVVTWVGSPWPPPRDIEGISVLLTENPETFRSVHRKFHRVAVTKPGFAPEILKAVSAKHKALEATFIGGLTTVHSKRARYIAHILDKGLPLGIHGYIERSLQGSRFMRSKALVMSAIRTGRPLDALSYCSGVFFETPTGRAIERVAAVMAPPLYGSMMLRRLADSLCTVNIHSDISGEFAGNYRLFQATGVGTCLITDETSNIAEIFEPGTEVLTFKSKAGLLDTLKWALSNPSQAAAISSAGQRRTLKDYSIRRFCENIVDACS